MVATCSTRVVVVPLLPSWPVTYWKMAGWPVAGRRPGDNVGVGGMGGGGGGWQHWRPRWAASLQHVLGGGGMNRRIRWQW
jgi:hypothetical protein